MCKSLNVVDNVDHAWLYGLPWRPRSSVCVTVSALAELTQWHWSPHKENTLSKASVRSIMPLLQRLTGVMLQVAVGIMYLPTGDADTMLAQCWANVLNIKSCWCRLFVISRLVHLSYTVLRGASHNDMWCLRSSRRPMKQQEILRYEYTRVRIQTRQKPLLILVWVFTYTWTWIQNPPKNIRKKTPFSYNSSSCRIRSDSQTTGLPVADNWIDEERWYSEA